MKDVTVRCPECGALVSEQSDEITRLRELNRSLNRRVQIAESAIGPNAMSERGRRVWRYVWEHRESLLPLLRAERTDAP